MRPAAVHDQVERTREALALFDGKPKAGLACVSAQHFDALTKELGEPVAVACRQLLEYGRLGNDPLESLKRRGGAVSANQQVNTANLRQLREQVRQPYLSDESSAADQQDVFSAQRAAHRKRRILVAGIEVDHGQAHARRRALRWTYGGVQRVWLFPEAQVPQQLLAGHSAIRADRRIAAWRRGRAAE